MSESLVERAFVINLRIRPDRLESFRKQAEGVSCLPEIEVWPAIHGDTCRAPEWWKAGDGAWGCMRSHLNLLEYCLNNRVGSYVVFEDDAQFAGTFDEYVPAAFGDLPDDWQQFYLGGQLMHEKSHPPVRISEHIYRPFNVNRTHAFAVSRSGMLPIYRHITDAPYTGTDHIDHHLGRWHEDLANRVYCVGQWQVGQHGSSSNVSGNTEPVQFYSNPLGAARSHWLYDNPTVVLFRGPKRLADQCLDFLHFGNTIDSGGYDVSLSDACRMRYPGPHLGRWFGWIAGEIANESSRRLPAVFHPGITAEMLMEHVAKTVIEVEHCATPDEVRQKIAEGLPGVKF